MNTKPLAERVLQVTHKTFVASAVWARVKTLGNDWTCVKAAPILHWMLLMDPAEASKRLRRMGCSYIWLKA